MRRPLLAGEAARHAQRGEPAYHFLAGITGADGLVDVQNLPVNTNVKRDARRKRLRIANHTVGKRDLPGRIAQDREIDT